MTEAVEIQVEARLILNPVFKDPTTGKLLTSVPITYMQPNLVVPITGISIVYAMNNLPTASAVLAVGRKDTSSLFSSDAPAVVKKLVRRIGALIEVKLTGVDRETEILGDLQEALGISRISKARLGTATWPSNFITLFDGFTTGANLQKSFEDAGYQLNLVHWLTELRDSTVLSTRHHPTTPYEFNKMNPNVSGVSLGGYVVGAQTNNVLTDLWGKGILPRFVELMGDPEAENTKLSRLGVVVESSLDAQLLKIGVTLSDTDRNFGNATARGALNRFVKWSALKNLDAAAATLGRQRIAKIKAQRTVDRKTKESEIQTWLRSSTAKIADSVGLGVFLEDIDAAIFDNSLGFSTLAKQGLPVLDDEAAILTDPDLFMLSRVSQGDLSRELPAVPLSISTDLSDVMIAQKVASALSALIDKDVTNLPTFWQRLQLMVSAFDVAIIPAVNSAAVVPVGIGYSKPWRTIEAAEVILSQGVGTTESIPRGCVLLQPDISISGYGGSMSQQVPFTSRVRFDLLGQLLAEYKERSTGLSADDKAAIKANIIASLKGEWVFLSSPDWLNFWCGVDGELAKTIKPNGTKDLQFSIAQGLEGQIAELKSKFFNPSQQERLQDLGTRTAMGRLLQEMFKKRGMTVASKFRLDIAPGSTVRVNTMGAGITNLPVIGDYSGFLQGLVTQVTLNINSETNDASTVLSMAFVRNEAEIATLSLSPERHPVYGGIWSGGHLASRDSAFKYRSLAIGDLNELEF